MPVDVLEREVVKEAIRLGKGRRSLTVDVLTIEAKEGTMKVKVQGRDRAYEDVEKVEVQKGAANGLVANISGYLAEVRGGLLVKDGEVVVVGRRINREEEKFYAKGSSVRVFTDPELTLYGRFGKIVLNQVQGEPRIYLDKGTISYQ